MPRRKTPAPPPPVHRRILAVATGQLLSNPVATGGGIVMSAMAIAIMTNALSLQPGRHPAPLFRDTSPIAADPTVTEALPLPVARPDGIGSLLGGSQPGQRPAVDPGLVAAIQAELKALGLYDGDVDGLVGPMTSAAIIKFQRARGLSPTGEPTGDVLAALKGAEPARQSAAEPVTPTAGSMAGPVPLPRPSPFRGAPAPEPIMATAPDQSAPAIAADLPPPAPIVTAERPTPPAEDPIAYAIRTGGTAAMPAAAEGTLAAEPAVQRTVSTSTERPNQQPVEERDARLARIQESLDLLGFGPLRPDGLWTSDTRDAIRRFEENRGLPVTGRINEQFLAELIKIGGLSVN